MKLYLARVWALGEWPFWYPNLLQGTPLMPLMHPGIFYPPSALFLLGDFLLAFNAYFLFHHLVLMASVYALCRFWGKSIQASLCASLTSLLGGYFLSIASVYNHFQSAIWFPLILMMWQKYLMKGSLKYFCAAVIFLSFQVLGGGPENAIFSVLLVYAHSLYLEEENGFIRKTLAALMLVLMALALSAVQWIPTFSFLKEIARGGGLNFATSTHWSMPPAAFFDLFLPENYMRFLESGKTEMDYFIHSLYMGIVPMFVLFSGLLIYRGNKEIRFWLAVFFLGVFFALGKFNPFYSLFHEWVPVFNMFRYPQKFFFLCAFALVFLLGLSLDRFMCGFNNNKQEMVKILLALFITSVGVAAIFGLHANRSGMETLMILLLLALAIFAMHFKKISQTNFFYFLLLLMIVDLMGKNSMIVPMIDKEFYTQTPVLAQRLSGTANSSRIYSGMLLDRESKIKTPTRNKLHKPFVKSHSPSNNILAVQLASRDQIYPNFGAIYNLAYVDGSATMKMKASYRWYKSFIFSKIEKKKLILKRSNVKYWVTEEFEQAPSTLSQRGIKKVKVFEDVLPRAFLVGESRSVPEDKLLDIYYDSKFDPLKQVLLTESVVVNKKENFSGQVEELRYSPNGVKVKTNQNGEGFLVLLDTFFPGWEVMVDGNSQSIYRANYFYRAVKLGPGNHNIEFSYTPVGLKMGLYISVCGLLLILFIYFKSASAKP
ncbi:MAG: YfhO family protein [Nitrospinae bacterium]|nr:YfhO family protein [Nitrospinota bacterium]